MDDHLSQISFERQSLLCDPEKMGEQMVVIIGCGTVGSHAAIQLALLGVKVLTN
jgi:tRNA A37 threonylcarbamoyladenosine dehydratase